MDGNVTAGEAHHHLGSDEKIKEMLERLQVAKEITKLFSLERYVYVSFCGVSIALLIYCAYRLITKPPDSGAIDYTVVTSILGSGGMFATSLGLLMFQWNKIVNLILSESTDKEDKIDGDQ